MLSFVKIVLSRSTRQDDWNAPHHWKAKHGHKSGWEIERDLAAERNKVLRQPGLF